MSSLKQVHPDYMAMKPLWELMGDAYAGETAIKKKRTVYLPAAPSMVLDGMAPGELGAATYDVYLSRAVFPESTGEAVERYLGLLHDKPATVELPTAMEYLLERATPQGEGLLALLRRINETQLIDGRLGLLLDVTTDKASAPVLRIAMYGALAVINWDTSEDGEGTDKVELVVLDESCPVREGFAWQPHDRYRVLRLEGGQYVQALFDLTNSQDYNDAALLPPLLRGAPCKEVPFVFVNSKDILAKPDKPPLAALARQCLTTYRGEADYRQNLFMQGQDTLVIIGAKAAPLTGVGMAVAQPSETRVGAGATLELDQEGDAKYIGVNSDGLSEQRESVVNDRRQCDTMAGTLMSPTAGKQESGDAMATRVGAQTASLTQVAKTGALALQTILRSAAVWMGLDPSTVTVTPNLEFAPNPMTTTSVKDLTAAKALGAPISNESIHANLVRGGFTQLSFDDEMKRIGEEEPLNIPPVPPEDKPAPTNANK